MRTEHQEQRGSCELRPRLPRPRFAGARNDTSRCVALTAEKTDIASPALRGEAVWETLWRIVSPGLLRRISPLRGAARLAMTEVSATGRAVTHEARLRLTLTALDV
jgi:hypothetical protein